MGIEYEGDKLDAILKLTKENNRMLHAQRRSAWLGGIFKIVMWAAFIIVPLWLYMQYLAPVIDSALKTMQQVQGTSAQAQAQFNQLNELVKKIPTIPGFNSQ